MLKSGGADGVGGFEEARGEHPGAGAVDGALAEHGAALFARWRGGGEAQAGGEAGREARSFKDYIVGRMKCGVAGTHSGGGSVPRDQGAGLSGRRDAGEAVRAQADCRLPVAEPIIRFETEPGHQMQADWATVGRGADKSVGLHCDARLEPHGLCRVLRRRAGRDADPLSRERVCWRLAACREKCCYDNMKTVVIERNTYGQGVHRFHAGFLDYAGTRDSCRDCANRIGRRRRVKSSASSAI